MNDKGDLANLNRRYVNAKPGDEGIPEYFKHRLSNDLNNDLIQAAVFRVLWYGGEPFYSLTPIENELDASRETVRTRLDEMVDANVLKKGSMNNGDYWWINFPHSNYPLPPDLRVDGSGEETETTLSEFFNQMHVQFGALALAATVIGGAIVWFGALESAGISPLPFAASEVIGLGLTTLFVSYLFLLLAIVVWALQRAFPGLDEELPEMLSSN